MPEAWDKARQPQEFTNTSRVWNKAIEPRGFTNTKEPQEFANIKLRPEEDVPDTTKNDQLKAKLHYLQDAYTELKGSDRAKHSRDIRNLINKIKDMPPAEAAQELIKAFNSQMHQTSKGFLGLGKKTQQEYVTLLNEKTHDYHYPRMLAMIVNELLQDPTVQSTLENSKIIDVITQINPANHTAYLGLGMPAEQRTQFLQVKNDLTEAGFNNRQIMQIYKSDDMQSVAESMHKSINHAIARANKTDKYIEEIGLGDKPAARTTITSEQLKALIENLGEIKKQSLIQQNSIVTEEDVLKPRRP